MVKLSKSAPSTQSSKGPEESVSSAENDKITADERMEIVLLLKQTVKEFDCQPSSRDDEKQMVCKDDQLTALLPIKLQISRRQCPDCV
jgi:hypothetical protein